MAQPDARAPRERGLIRHRTAPEAAPMVAGRASEPPSRGAAVAAVAMLATGLVAVLVALGGLGSRILPTARTVRDTSLDPVATFFMGTSGSMAELALAIALIALLPVGIALAWFGYRRLSDDGPSLAAVHQSNSPNAVISRIEGPGGH